MEIASNSISLCRGVVRYCLEVVHERGAFVGYLFKLHGRSCLRGKAGYGFTFWLESRYAPARKLTNVGGNASL